MLKEHTRREMDTNVINESFFFSLFRHFYFQISYNDFAFAFIIKKFTKVACCIAVSPEILQLQTKSPESI